jgi:hypothetical protein
MTNFRIVKQMVTILFCCPERPPASLLASISRSYFAVVDFCACRCIGLYSDDLAWDAFAELEFTRSNSAVEWVINPSLTVSAKPHLQGMGAAR